MPFLLSTQQSQSDMKGRNDTNENFHDRAVAFVCIAAALTQRSERTGIENKWYVLTGRVVALKVEADGDLHIALEDPTSDKTRNRCL
jgi:hypothetical protein